ncbi:MAG: histidine phosphatase family protein [candidate division SR1 bacterium]|nr:histidine phosphatase family protein [candidate division SR1 bacterium]
MSVKITYFAHGTTVDNEKHISSGWSDAPLSDLGIQQSKDLQKQINLADFAVVFCSDAQRSVHSATLAFENIVPMIQDPRLRECNYGTLNGTSSDIVEPLQEANFDTKFPEGESYEDVKARIADFLDYIKKNYDGKHIAIVGHKAPQFAIEVLVHKKSWEQALAEDWRKKKAWQPGWEYILE